MVGFEKVQAEVLAVLGELGVTRAVPGSAFRMDAMTAVDSKQLLTILIDYRDLKQKHSPPPLPGDTEDIVRGFIEEELDPPPKRGPR